MPTRKTLIVLDTNRLRQIIADGPAYHAFTFSAEFERLKKFMNDNGLGSFVYLAVTRMTVLELLQQKIEQFEEDQKEMESIIQRMSALPGVNFESVQMPEAGFDCRAHLTPKMEEFLQQSGVLLIDLPDDKHAIVFKKTVDRAINKCPPFYGKADTGFKDVVIWESLLHFDRIAEFDKVYMVSADNGFDKDCKAEFEAEKQRIMEITSSVQMVIKSLEEDYEAEIEKNKYARFAETDYFKDHIHDAVASLSTLVINDGECTVTDVEVFDYLDAVEYPSEEDSGISAILVTTARGKALSGGTQRVVKIKIKTSLDEAQGIQGSDYEVDL